MAKTKKTATKKSLNVTSKKAKELLLKYPANMPIGKALLATIIQDMKGGKYQQTDMDNERLEKAFHLVDHFIDWSNHRNIKNPNRQLLKFAEEIGVTREEIETIKAMTIQEIINQLFPSPVKFKALKASINKKAKKAGIRIIDEKNYKPHKRRK